MSFNEANTIRASGKFAGVIHKESEAPPLPPLIAVPVNPPSGSWQEHGFAVEVASARVGIRTGEEYNYNSASLMINPNGDPEATINLVDDTSGRSVQLRHNYTSNVTSFVDSEGLVETAGHEEVNAVVSDIAPAWNKDAAGMFTRLSEQATGSEGMDQKTSNALVSAPRPWVHHSEAQEAAATAVGLKNGVDHEYLSTALMVNPDGEPEAYVNVKDRAGNSAQIKHNYTEGTSSYLTRGGNTSSSKPHDEELQAVLSDVGGGNDSSAFFDKLRGASLDQPKLHSKLRNALNK